METKNNREERRLNLIKEAKTGNANAGNLLVNEYKDFIHWAMWTTIKPHIEFVRHVLDELESESLRGFWQAVTNFDTSVENPLYQFSTYAYRTIQGYIYEYLKKERPYTTDEQGEKRYISFIHLDTFDRTAGESDDYSDDRTTPADQTNIPGPNTYIIDTDAEGIEFIDLTAVNNLTDEKHQERPLSDIDLLLKPLNPVEQYIIQYTFGLNDVEPKDLRQLSKELNLSVERTSVIKDNAMRKMRNSAIQNNIHA